MGASPIPLNRQPGSNGQNQSSWMQPGPSQQQQNFNMRNGPSLPARGPSQPQSAQGLHPPGQAQHMQRPGSTSQQVLASQMPSQMSPGLPNNNNNTAGKQFQMMSQNIALPPPLDKAKFEESYAAFCTSRPIPRDERLMKIDNRSVDLHALHHHVLSEGGSNKVVYHRRLLFLCNHPDALLRLQLEIYGL